MAQPAYVLVTGATGFIGAHIVDALLARGIRVRGTTRTLDKAQSMLNARPEHTSALDFVVISDFASPKIDLSYTLADGIDAVVHVASPCRYDISDNEAELVAPAINGVKGILRAAAAAGTVKRVVITSSFAAVLDADRVATETGYFVYTGADWNPITYAESVAPETSPVVAYRGSKKFAELAAWEFVKEHAVGFDLVTLCPPMTFGPIVHPISRASQLNDSNANIWKLMQGEMPVARVPFWIDVRDLAQAHVEALLKKEAGGKRYIPASPERFTYALAAQIAKESFPSLAHVTVAKQAVDQSHGVDGETVRRELGVEYCSFKQCMADLMGQLLEMSE